MQSESLWVSVSQLLAREAVSLDGKNWEAWLDLYEPGAEYWVPAWTDGGELTYDPKTQVSLIYYANRSGLEDRVYRLTSGKSAAGNLEFRTCHVSQLVAAAKEGDLVRARSHWHMNALLNEEVVTYFGWAEYRLAESGGNWKIRGKKTALLNDRPDTVLDFYLI